MSKRKGHNTVNCTCLSIITLAGPLIFLNFIWGLKQFIHQNTYIKWSSLVMPTLGLSPMTTMPCVLAWSSYLYSRLYNQGCQLGLMKLVENTKQLCHCKVALCMLREWQGQQNCSTTTSPISGTTFST